MGGEAQACPLHDEVQKCLDKLKVKQDTLRSPEGEIAVLHGRVNNMERNKLSVRLALFVIAGIAVTAFAMLGFQWATYDNGRNVEASVSLQNAKLDNFMVSQKEAQKRFSKTLNRHIEK